MSSVRRIKRDYVTARNIYTVIDDDMRDLQRIASRLPPGILIPAIDALFDRLDLAAREYRTAHDACVARGIRSCHGLIVVAQFRPEEDEFGYELAP